MMKTVMVMVFLAVALGVFAQEGVIKNLSGTVELKPAGASAFTLAKQGDAVARDTIVSTGFKSTAVITVGGTTLTVRPLTRLSLEEISVSQGTEKLDVNLQAGRVRAEVRPPAGTRADMSVRTSGATASVRGTEFEMDTSTLTVTTGTVAYSGAGGGIMLVSSGGTSLVDPLTRRVLDPIEAASAALLPPPPIGTAEQFIQTGGGPRKVEFSLELTF
jgi:hypothetical protein